MTETAKSAFRFFGVALIIFGIVCLFGQHAFAESAESSYYMADDEYERENAKFSLLMADIANESGWPAITLGSLFILGTCMTATVPSSSDEDSRARCKHCGTPLEADAGYCEQCGARIV